MGSNHNIHDKTGVSEREAKIFKDALLAHAKLPENRVCADCPKTGPTWCSVNLGVFICMDCAGGHRHLGVHLSKVRSLTLDTMTATQFRFLKSMDNVRANSYWEANMPPDFVKTEANRASTLNTKYKFRKWIDTTLQEPTLDNFPNHPWFQETPEENAPPAAVESAQRAEPAGPPAARLVAPAATASDQRVVAAPPAFDLLGGFDDFPPVPTAPPRPSHTRTPSAPEARSGPPGVDLLAAPTGTSSSHNLDAAFDSFAALSVAPVPPQPRQQPAAAFDPFAASQTFVQPEPAVGGPTPSASAPNLASQAVAPQPNWAGASGPTNWQAPQQAPLAAPAEAQPASSARPKKSAAEIAAQVQSLYQQPGNSFPPPSIGLQPQHGPHHARAASAGMLVFPGTGPYPGQLQPPVMATMAPAQKMASAPMAQPYFAAAYQPPGAFPGTAGPAQYGAPSAAGFSAMPLPTNGTLPYSATNSAAQPQIRNPPYI